MLRFTHPWVPDNVDPFEYLELHHAVEHSQKVTMDIKVRVRARVRVRVSERAIALTLTLSLTLHPTISTKSEQTPS